MKHKQQNRQSEKTKQLSWRKILYRTMIATIALGMPWFIPTSASGDDVAAPAGEKIVLFDGHSLAGWEGNTKVWRVEDGLIVGGSMEWNPHNEFLATVDSFDNFDLHLEYKLVGTKGFVNSGVQFASVRLQKPDYEMSGFQADIGAGTTGNLYDESRRHKNMARAPAAIVKQLEKVGDWNDYEIRCTGHEIQIWLNGTRTVDYTETDPSIPMSGLIGLQIHGGNNAQVYFRNIVIQKL